MLAKGRINDSKNPRNGSHDSHVASSGLPAEMAYLGHLGHSSWEPRTGYMAIMAIISRFFAVIDPTLG